MVSQSIYFELNAQNSGDTGKTAGFRLKFPKSLLGGNQNIVPQMLLGKILKHIRVFHHYNQLELAEKLAVSRSYISEIEADKKIPTIDFLKKYSEFFDIPLSNIMMFAESKNLKKSAKSKAKFFLTSTAIKFLDWASKEDVKKEA